SDMDDNSWVYFKKETSSITAPDYSIKMTKGGYSFVVNCVDGTVSDPVYNGELLTQKKPASFADDSWADIKNNLSHNRNYYPIGSEKIVNMNLEGTPKDYKLRLVNTESCGDYTGSRTSCGVVIEFVTTIGDHVMNSSGSNAGGWRESEMRTYLNTETDSSSNPTSIYSKLPSDLKDIIILTSPVISGSGFHSESEDAEDYLYLLATKEIGINVPYNNYDNKNNVTKILKYYSDNNNNAARNKSDRVTGGGSSAYWLRTASSGDYQSFYYIWNGENKYNSSSSNYSVAPAFRILD
ncbi:MAG: hypothetical protein J6D28_05830, partial [Bacilli bacterium]|nr:hypothetical protein [Bacilli bacterium]